jgi:membrane protein implicated in regulation of membrane protease activity
VFDDPLLAAGGFFFYLLGIAWIDEARRGRGNWGTKAMLLPFALWFLYENSSLLSSHAIGDRVIGYAAVFCVASPVLGFILFGRQGRILKALFQIVLFLVLGTALTFALAVGVFDDQLTPVTAIAGFSLALLAFLPYKTAYKALQRRQQQRRYRKEQERVERERRAEAAAQAAQQAQQEAVFRKMVDRLRQ